MKGVFMDCICSIGSIGTAADSKSAIRAIGFQVRILDTAFVVVAVRIFSPPPTHRNNDEIGIMNYKIGTSATV